MKLIYTVPIILCFTVRLIFIVFFPAQGGDAGIYQLVADNILRGCGVSLSPLNIHADLCIPHFGGNQGPGYPFFMSIIWKFSNHNDSWIRLSQALLYSLAAARLIYSINVMSNNKKIFWIATILLSFSPLTVAWPRYLQTESLSLAITLVIIAELILSYKEKNLRYIKICLLFTLATWIRLDNIFLAAPIALSSFLIHDFRTSLKKGLIIAILFSIPWGLWTVRNINEGVRDIIPTDMIMPDGSKSPSGYLAWIKTWMTNEYEKPSSMWNVNRKIYSTIEIPDYAYKSTEEKEKVSLLLEKISSLDGQDFPEEIDSKFYSITRHKVKKYSLDYWVYNPIIRSVRLWTNPFNSFGWPSELPDSGISKSDRLAVSQGNLDILVEKIIKYPYRAISKLFILFYRISIYLLLALLIYYIFKKERGVFRYFLFVTISFFLVKTLFAALNGNIETRYTVPVHLFMETSIIIGLLKSNLFSEKKKVGMPNPKNMA